MQDISLFRRIDFFCATLLCLSLLVWTSSTSDTTENFVIDIARVNRDGTAFVSVLSTLLALPAIDALLGEDLPAVRIAMTETKAALDQFHTLTSTHSAFPVTSHTIIVPAQKAANNALFVLHMVQKIAAKVPDEFAPTVKNYIAAAQTLIPIVQVAVGTVNVQKGNPVMTEAEALLVSGD